MSAPALADVDTLPGNVLLRALYERLFRPDLIGPAIVIPVTVVGGYFGLRISPHAWPLAALAVGGIAAALWHIVAGDRSRAANLVMWQTAEQARRWEATGLTPPVSVQTLRAWSVSDAFRSAKPADQAQALVALGDLDRADKIIGNARAKSADETADVVAARFAVDFSRNGDADYSKWRAAADRLKAASARRHKVSMAIYEAAAATERGQWLITLDRTAQELGPFPIEPRRRALNIFIPILPMLLGIVVVEALYLLFGSALSG